MILNKEWNRIVKNYILLALVVTTLYAPLLFKPLVVFIGIIIFKKHIWVIKMIKEKLISMLLTDFRILGYLGIKAMSIMGVILLVLGYSYILKVYDVVAQISIFLKVFRPLFAIIFFFICVYIMYKEGAKSLENKNAIKFILGAAVDILTGLFCFYTLKNNWPVLPMIGVILFALYVNLIQFSSYWKMVNLLIAQLAVDQNSSRSSTASDLSFLCELQGEAVTGMLEYDEIPWNFKKLVKMRIIIVKDTCNVNRLNVSGVEFKVNPKIKEIYDLEKKNKEKS